MYPLRYLERHWHHYLLVVAFVVLMLTSHTLAFAQMQGLGQEAPSWSGWSRISAIH